MKNSANKKNKEKFGTALDKSVIKILKDRSYQEGRPIGDILHDAIVKYNETEVGSVEQRLAAVKRLCSKPFNLSRQEIDEILLEDYFDQ